MLIVVIVLRTNVCVIDIVLVECSLLMDHLCLTGLLLFGISLSAALERHVDYTKDPPVFRNCQGRQCHCGTQPKICNEEGSDDTCKMCPAGTFQPYTIDTWESKQCQPHTECTKG